MDLNEDLKSKLEELILQAEFEGEKRVNRLTLILVGITAIVISVTIALTKLYLNTVFDIIGFGFIGLYHCILYFILKTGNYNKFLKFISVTIHITAVTIILYGYSFNDGMLHSLRTVTVSSYFIMIIIAGFYQRPFVPIYTAVLASFQYFILFLIATIGDDIILGNAETFYEPVYSIGELWTVISVLLVSGLSVSFIASRLRVFITRSIIAEADSYKQSVEKRALEETSKMKLNFFINIAHETKTPLTIISNYIEKDIQKRGPSEEISIAKQNLQKLIRDTINFLDSEKLKKGHFIFNHNQVTDVSDFTEKKIGLFKEIASEKSIEITNDIENSCLSKIDPFALDRILNNILDNAIKFTEKGGNVSVILKPDNEHIIISVKDSGTGIPEKEQKNIFKPFYQIYHDKKNKQGIGLGLSIVRKILDDLSASIDIKSEEGKGTEFIIKLHRYNDTAEYVSEINPSNPINPNIHIKLEENEFDKDKPTILIVEDNIELLAVLQNEFITEFNVFTAVNGKEALENLEQIMKPDLIISDIMMDVMDGEEFFSVVISNPDYKEIPFIFLTAKTGHESRMGAYKKGAIDFIAKPFNMEELKIKVNSILSYIEENSERIKTELQERVKKAIFESGDLELQKNKRRLSIYEEHKLSPRKREICELIFQGLYNKEIAYKLDIDEKTVEKHITEIYRIFKVSNRIELFKIFN